MEYALRIADQLRQQLRSLRKARGLSQAMLGRLLGVTQRRIAEIEANPAVVSIEQITRILGVLGAELVLRETPPPLLRHAQAFSREDSTPTIADAAREPGKSAPANFRLLLEPPPRGEW